MADETTTTENKPQDWGDKIKKVLMALPDAYVEIEKTVSTRGIIVVIMTCTVCYMVASKISVSEGFGKFYELVLSVYFGAKLGTESIERIVNSFRNTKE
jgi:hypothetical protein